MEKIIIIPDIHGRKFWRPIVEKYKNDTSCQIIFLGDYLDPYLWEFTNQDDICIPNRDFINEVIDNFAQIIDEARESTNIKLLLGNHDLHYFPEFKGKWGCRRIDQKFDYISGLFTRNLDLFNVVWRLETPLRNYLFSHAGIIQGWLDIITNKRNFGGPTEDYFYSDIMDHSEEERELLNLSSIEDINSLIHHKIGREALKLVSRERGGDWPYGSCMWADIHEHFNDILNKNQRLPEYQIFSHTLNYPDYDLPHIDKNMAMLDCRKGFELNLKTGEIDVL